jgi:hypothetical protein
MLKYLKDNCDLLSKYSTKPFTKNIKSVSGRDRDIYHRCQSSREDEAKKILADLVELGLKVDKTISIIMGDQPPPTSTTKWVVPIDKNASPGLTRDDCMAIHKAHNNGDYKCQFIDLSLPDHPETGEACILLFTGDLTSLLGVDLNKLYDEHSGLDFDKAKLMYGRVVNKITRYNLCYGDAAQEPDYEKGIPRVVSYDSVPLLQKCMRTIPSTLGKKFEGLNAESILYFDTERCGLGFHGDSERKRVNVIRLGAPFSLHFQWFCNSKKIGQEITFDLPGNCFYIMSEKATGQDWKKRGAIALRHATGKIFQSQ